MKGRHADPTTNRPQSPRLRQELVDALKSKRTEFREICEKSGVAGMSITVVDHGETIFQHNVGYRDLDKKEPVTSDTIFPIASLTKSFTGACLNRLRAEETLSFDDPIQRLLPEAKSQDPIVAETATVADLLGHRTGLQRADNMWLGSNGELLFNRDQTTTVFRQLRPRASLRSQFLYNNICYAILGEIIIKLTGQPYHTYLKENILDPLNMTRTVVTHEGGLLENTSKAYSTLDNGEPYNVPLPGSTAAVAMGSAGGLMSSTNDLSKYYKALMSSWRIKAQSGKASLDVEEKKPVFDDVSWLFAPLQIMEMPAFRDKSYATGWVRSQLLTTVGDIGVNPGLVDAMPLLAHGIDLRLALWHQGSLVGATSFVMLLPETESAVVVLTNTMALNDAADWTGQLLVETLLDSLVRNNYVRLASASAERALKKYAELTQKVEEGRKSGKPDRPLSDYVGSYVGFGGIFCIDVVEGDSGLEVLFQGRESQKYRLKHHHDETFTWFTTWNEQIEKGRFISFDPALYFIRFEAEEGRGVVALNWVHDTAIPEGDSFVKERDGKGLGK